MLSKCPLPAPSGASYNFPGISGQYYSYPSWNGSGVAAAGTVGLLIAHPIILKAGRTLDRIAVSHNNTLTAGETCRLGIFNDNGNGYPGALLLDAGTVDLSTAPGMKAITISQAIATSGVYWLAAVRQGATATAQLVHSAGGSSSSLGLPSEAAQNFEQVAAFSEAGVAGALPANFTAVVTKRNAASNSAFIPTFVRIL